MHRIRYKRYAEVTSVHTHIKRVQHIDDKIVVLLTSIHSSDSIDKMKKEICSIVCTEAEIVEVSIPVHVPETKHAREEAKNTWPCVFSTLAKIEQMAH